LPASSRACRRRWPVPDLADPNFLVAIAFVILALAVVAVIVYIQEGQRRIPIQYASRVRGRRMYQGGATFLPLRVNQAGVIPIIFAREHPAVPDADRFLLPGRRAHR
jgi:preprotein translocase subunit SecY